MPVISAIDNVNNAASFSFYTNNNLTSTFTLAPSTGTVTATGLVNPVILSLGDHQANISAISKWCSDVSNIFNLAATKPTATNQIYNKNNLISTGTFIIDGYTYNASYNSASKMITINPRLATAFTWGGFLCYLKYHNQFISEISSNY